MPYWYYEKEALRDSPSFHDGIDFETECTYRKYGAQLIKDICITMDLGPRTAATGVMYFHRFYMIHSFKAFPSYVTACCCLFLAGKAEETPKKCKDIIKIAKKLLDEKNFSTFGKNPKEQVMILEKILLKTIRFDLKVHHPYNFLMQYSKYLKGQKRKIGKMVNMAWIFINDSLSTTLPLQWEPEIIAIAVMHLAGKLVQLDVSDWHKKKPHHLRWWDEFVEDLSKDSVEDICHQILDIYSPGKTQIQQNYQACHKGNKSIMNQKLNETFDNQPKSVKTIPYLDEKKKNIVDSNDNVVNALMQSRSISPLTTAAVSPTDPRLEYLTACGYHVCGQFKTDSEKIGTVNTSQSLTPSNGSVINSSKHSFIKSSPNFNITITIENHNFHSGKNKNLSFDKQSITKDDKVSDSKQNHNSQSFQREFDSDSGNDSGKFFKNRWFNSNYKLFQNGDNYENKEKFYGLKSKSFQDRGPNQLCVEPEKKGFENNDDSVNDRYFGRVGGPFRKRRFNDAFSTENSDSGDSKFSQNYRSFESNSRPVFKNYRYHNKFNGTFRSRGFGRRNNGFYDKNERFQRRGFKNGRFGDENLVHNDSSGMANCKFQENNILSENIGFNNSTSSSYVKRSWSVEKQKSKKNFHSGILDVNDCNTKSPGCKDESWSPERRDQKMNNDSSKSPDINGCIDSTNNISCMDDESWSPDEDRETKKNILESLVTSGCNNSTNNTIYMDDESQSSVDSRDPRIQSQRRRLEEKTSKTFSPDEKVESS